LSSHRTITKQKPRRPHQSRRLVSAESIKSKTQSGDAPHLDFLNQFSGTLQEPIAEGDLATLNKGLAFLFDWLRQARQQYDEATDGGRVAAFTALGGLSHFVMLFNSSPAKPLFMPINNLIDALAALEKNNVKPILKPVPRRGRAPSSHAYESLVGHAAATVTRLRNSGILPEEAHDFVAKELDKLGVRSMRGSGSMTANTIRHWCDEVASDASRLGTAAMMYDFMFTDIENRKFKALSLASSAKICAKNSLQVYVYETFPELRTPAKNPVRPPI
jgi:hypothetical protein